MPAVLAGAVLFLSLREPGKRSCLWRFGGGGWESEVTESRYYSVRNCHSIRTYAVTVRCRSARSLTIIRLLEVAMLALVGLSHCK